MTVLIDDATCYCYVDTCWLVLTYVDSSSCVDMLLSFYWNFRGNWALPVLLYVAACRCYVDTCWLTLTNVDKKLCYLCCHICIENFEAIERWVYNGNPKSTLKILLASWFLVYFFKRFRSFIAENLKSVGQRAAKLPAIKLWEWLNRDRGSNPSRLADWGRGRLADFFLRPPTLTASNFAALWPTDP